MWSNILDRISFMSLFLVVVLLPVFFLPFTRIPIETSKGLLLVVGLAVSIIFWAVARFSDGKFTIPRSSILLAGAGITLATLLSAFFSSASGTSFFGVMFDVGTFWFIFSAFLLMLASSIILKDAENARTVLFGVLISSSVVIVFQVLRFFLPEALSLGLMGANTDNLFGTFNALGLLGAFSVITSLLALDFFDFSKRNRILLQILIVLSLFVVAAANFLFAWEMLGVFALVLFVYKMSFFSKNPEGGEHKSKFPAFSFAIVMVSLLFFMSGQFVGNLIPSKLGVTNTEVSPTFSATMQVAKSSLAENPVFGIGPNRFAESWAMYKSENINSGPFWDYSFGSGSGVIPTLAINTGGLGIVAWIAFMVLLIMAGIKSVFAVGTSKETIAFFVLSLFLFVSSFFYFTGSVMILLAFAFTGIFVGLISAKKTNGQMTVLFLDNHRKSFFFILFLVLVMIAGAAAAFKYIERFASVPYFRSTLTATTIESAQTSISNALSLHVSDLYLRTYAQVYIAQINQIVGSVEEGEELNETQRADLQTAVEQAISGARLAVEQNPSNYINHQALGNVYSTVSALGVEDAYEQAIASYTKAKELNPLNPGIDLAMSRTALNNNKLSEAKEYANKSLALKPNLIDTLLTLSQISTLEKNKTEAVKYAEQALALDPTNEDLANYVQSVKDGTNETPPVTEPDTTPELN